MSQRTLNMYSQIGLQNIIHGQKFGYRTVKDSFPNMHFHSPNASHLFLW